MHHGVDGARDPDVLAHVVLDEREAALAEQLLDVGDGPGDQVVDGDHLVAPRQQRPAQVGAEEPGAAGDDDARHQSQP